MRRSPFPSLVLAALLVLAGTTRGELVLTVSSTRQRGVVYGVEVGRMLRARRTLNGGEFHQLRTLVEAAQQKLATLSRDGR